MAATTSAPIILFLLAIALGCVSSTRILDEEADDLQPQLIPDSPDPPAAAIVPALSPPSNTLPSGHFPAADAAAPTEAEAEEDAAASAPVDDVAPPAAETVPSPPLSFFMHDILGGSNPSARVVSGITSSTEINGLPFSKTNGGVFPVNGGVPLLNGNGNYNGLINNKNVPFLTGLNGGQAQASTIIQNNGNNNPVNAGNKQPFVTAGQLPAGATLQKVMFGTITVIDDELTEGHELGSGVVGRAQGFYLASSLDGASHTMALTVLLHGGHNHQEENAISFFGVHRTASPVSHIAVVGGTGEYENAKGYATIESLHQLEDQYTTDGVETIMKFTVYLSH